MHSGKRENDSLTGDTRRKKRRRLEETQFIQSIPVELLWHILSFTDFDSLLVASLVSKDFYQAATTEYLWQEQLQKYITFHHDHEKIKKENETYHHLFFRLFNRKDEHTFIVVKQLGQLGYDPLAYINKDPVLVMNRISLNTDLFKKLSNALRACRYPLEYVCERQGIGPAFILELDISIDKATDMAIQGKHQDLLVHIIKIHPNLNLASAVKNQAKTLLVKYEEGKIAELGVIRETPRLG